MATSNSFQIAQFISFGGAAWLSGNIAALSLITLPALTLSHTSNATPPSTLALQWAHLYHFGKSQNPPIAALTAATFSYLAWSVRTGSPLNQVVGKNGTVLYGLAAILTLGIAPFTIVFMAPTNGRLLAKAEKAREKGKGKEKEKVVGGEANDREIMELLRKWTVLNGVRSLLPLLGATVAVVAALV